MRGLIRPILSCLALLLLVVPAFAEHHEEGGNIARITYWTLERGSEEKFVAGIKSHNQLHADHNDPHPIFTGVILNGHQQDVWVRGSLGHKWSDFDAAGAVPNDVDQEHMAAHLQPSIASSRTVFYQHLPGLSNPAATPGAMAKVIFFHLHPGKDQVFAEAVGKIHQALSAQESWRPYDWYMVADGGKQPTWAVVLPSDDWAGLAPDDPAFEAAMGAKWGEEAPKIFDALFSAVASQYSHTISFPADLAYAPSGGE